MKNFIYNDFENYKGMDIDEQDYEYEYDFVEEIESNNEYNYFRLFFTDEILNFFVKESNEYYTNILRNNFGNNFKEIILSKKNYNTYPYLYVKKGISKEDIIAFIGIRLYMGIHKYTSIESYWNNSNLYTNIISSIIPKNYYFIYKMFILSLRRRINSDLLDDNDPRGKINFFLEKLSLNF